MAKSTKSKQKVASASLVNKRTRNRRPMDEAVVKAYAAQLKAALGTSEFEMIFTRLCDDRAVRQEEAVAIASLLLEARIAPSTARGTALGRITKLHNSLVTFKLKQKAVGGRSAA